MSFMEIETIRKGTVYEADCQKCGCTNFWHEWVHGGQGSELAEYPCDQCGHKIGNEPIKHPRKEYACRYSAPGYLDCTDWNYGTNRRILENDTRAMYGDD